MSDLNRRGFMGVLAAGMTALRTLVAPDRDDTEPLDALELPKPMEYMPEPLSSLFCIALHGVRRYEICLPFECLLTDVDITSNSEDSAELLSVCIMTKEGVDGVCGQWCLPPGMSLHHRFSRPLRVFQSGYAGLAVLSTNKNSGIILTFDGGSDFNASHHAEMQRINQMVARRTFGMATGARYEPLLRPNR